MNKQWERASIETFYDGIKWIAFLFLAVVWLGETPRSIQSHWPWLIPFVIILFVINLLRERQLEMWK